MPFYVVSDFKGGLHRTRLAVTAAPGTLRTLSDAHINRGGEIEKRKAFVVSHQLPPGATVGLAAVGGALYAFGTPAAPTMPAGVTYQRLQPSDLSSVTRILDVKAFAGALYVTALCSNGSVHHFYNGTQVTVFTGQTAAEQGRILLPFNKNMYAASGSVLHRSKISDATDWDTASTGAGFFDMSTHAQGSEALTGLAEYQNNVAVFSRRTTQIWQFAADPAASVKGNVLRNTGCVAPQTCVSVAGTDVFFLSDSGVRSLRARDITDSPSAADVGTAIDDLVADWLADADSTDLEVAHAVIEPTDGRYWLVLGSIAYVFSYFPATKISAWSTYTLPGEVTATVAVDRRLYVRVADTIYLYGGADGGTYDATQAVAELPYLDARSLPSWKSWPAVEIAAEGTWDVYVNLNPDDPTAEDLVGQISGTSVHQLDTPMLGESPLVKLRFASSGETAARLGAVAVRYLTAGKSA